MKLQVKQIRSMIGRKPKQRKTLKALGLGKTNKIKIHKDTPVIRGMINKVSHLLEVKEIDE